MWLDSVENDKRPLTSPLARSRQPRWDEDVPTVASSVDLPYNNMRSGIRDFLGNRRLSDFPDVPDGSNAWLATFDRLSKRITSQKHDLWDCQAKLRIEAEKNRDLVKIIQAERRKHREVEYVLTSKIDSLELELKALHKHLSYSSLDQCHDSAHDSAQQAATRRSEGQNAKLHSLNDEAQRTPSSPSPESKQWADSQLVSDMQKEIAALKLEIESLRSENMHTASHAKAPTTPPSVKKTAAPARDLLQDNEALLASNKELHDKMRLQSAELAMQIEHYSEMRRHLELLSSHQQNEAKEISALRKTHERSTPKHKQSSQTPNLEPPLTPLASSVRDDVSKSDSEDHFSSDTASIASSTLQPALHSSSIQSDASTTNTLASSTSTPTTKPKNAADDPSVERLDRLYHKLKHGKLSHEDVARYEEIYRNSLQSFAERPQLRSDTQQLISDLQRQSGSKHSRLMSVIKDDAF